MMSQAVQGLQICPGDNGQFKCEWLEIEWHKYAFLIIFTFSSFVFSFASYTHYINIDLKYRRNTLNVNKIN